ncbi:hypothetical protein [Paraburkholderia xenovorans]|nr:hypothetical protein [Paraburkholderia xenovorans]
MVNAGLAWSCHDDDSSAAASPLIGDLQMDNGTGVKRLTVPALSRGLTWSVESECRARRGNAKHLNETVDIADQVTITRAHIDRGWSLNAICAPRMKNRRHAVTADQDGVMARVYRRGLTAMTLLESALAKRTTRERKGAPAVEERRPQLIHSGHASPSGMSRQTVTASPLRVQLLYYCGRRYASAITAQFCKCRLSACSASARSLPRNVWLAATVACAAAALEAVFMVDSIQGLYLGNNPIIASFCRTATNINKVADRVATGRINGWPVLKRAASQRCLLTTRTVQVQ